MEIITDIYGKKHKVVGCLGCYLRKGQVPSTGMVLATKYFEVEQDTEIPIPAFMIVVSRRHFKGFGDLTKPEQKELIDILVGVRKAMEKALGIKVVYIFQNEDSSSHFHVWMFPRFKWMDKFGNKIESVRPIMEYARKKLKTKKNLEEVKRSREKLRKYLTK
jgi:diadenosine tetraphosphate (Ap4A) HIT family hydrolase